MSVFLGASKISCLERNSEVGLTVTSTRRCTFRPVRVSLTWDILTNVLCKSACTVVRNRSDIQVKCVASLRLRHENNICAFREMRGGGACFSADANDALLRLNCFPTKVNFPRFCALACIIPRCLQKVLAKCNKTIYNLGTGDISTPHLERALWWVLVKMSRVAKGFMHF